MHRKIDKGSLLIRLVAKQIICCMMKLWVKVYSSQKS